MRVVRQRMIKPFNYKLPLSGSFILLLPLLGLLSSCNPTEITGNGVQSSVVNNTDGSYNNMAYVFTDSPYILGGPTYSPRNPNMGSFVDRQPKLINPLNKSSLVSDCIFNYNFASAASTLPDCIRSLKDSKSDQATPRLADRTYIFPANSPEFYQTNTLYHLVQSTETFMRKLGSAYDIVRYSYTNKPKSIPSYLPSSGLFWFRALDSKDNKLFQSSSLTSYSQCELDNNSSFSPIGPKLCFGYMSTIPGFLFAQDPSVIYHELGHAFVSIMMNLRNGTGMDYHPLRSNLGSFGYDEAGSINEGIADYFSFIMNKREAIGEFGLGTTAKQSRPLSESSHLHIAGVEETSEGRLSYPQFLHYDPNYPGKIQEAVHYAGQITSHYLVALTKTFKDPEQCDLSSESDGGHEKATTWTTLLLAETLSELGDLNARGVDRVSGSAVNSANPNFFTNLDRTNSYLWAQVVNQVTYRKFYQVFAKNINKYITNKLCPAFTKDESEKLLDDYGLLLFKTYNDNGNSTKSRTVNYNDIDTSYLWPSSKAPTPVSEDNRRKSVLVSKQQLDIAVKTETQNRATYYVVDGIKEMNAQLKELLFKGFTVPLSTHVASTAYNNSNLKLSPGEVVAIIPNLFNKSNSPIAGVQLLATDWDHVHITDQKEGNFKPCKVDDVTTVDQGAVEGLTCNSTQTDYKRLISTNGTFPPEAAAPVCLVQLEEGSSARWVSQNEFRNKQGLNLTDKDCLGYKLNESNPDFTMNPHECLVRFLPGANDAFFSKIDSQKSFSETLFPDGKNIKFDPGNSLMLEINKWIPPGTKFRCRLRARFSNCSDCYTDKDELGNDDFPDYELNGAKPFKIINFDFEVND